MSHPADTDGDWRALFDLPARDLPLSSVYLDTAAHAPMLRTARDAGVAALAGGNRPWMPDAPAWEARVERARALAAAWFDGDADAIAFVPSVAYGVATAASNLPLARAETVLVLDGQFPSNLLAWQERCQAAGARIAVARRGRGQDWTQAVLAAIDATPALRIAALAQAHWHDGALLDLDAISAVLHERGVALVLDLSQSLGALPADIARWKPAFVVSVGYKWLLGPTGLSLLWAGPRWREHGVPIEQHWSARDDRQVWTFDPQMLPRFRSGARRFDAGGLLDPLRLGMFEAAQAQLRHWGPGQVQSHLRRLLDALDAGLDAHDIGDWNTPGHAPHFCGVRPRPERFEAIATALKSARIECTARLGALRIAPHLHVSPDDIAHCVEVIAAAR